MQTLCPFPWARRRHKGLVIQKSVVDLCMTEKRLCLFLSHDGVIVIAFPASLVQLKTGVVFRNLELQG
jgi:hypothetical protein